MQALILAAGRGSRLGQKGEQTPKCLLEVGPRRVIEHQLEILAEAGVAPVGMVVGYCADEIREVVGIRAEYIVNPRWSTTNSLYSFWLARDWITGPFLVLNSDTVIHPEILERLLNEDGDSFAYDSSSGDAREHMKVKIANGYLLDMSKQMPPEEASGENVGILKFTEKTGRALFKTAEELLNNGHEKSWLGTGVQEISKTYALRAVDVAGIPWGEIDSCYDLDHVRKLVVPSMTPAALKRKLYRRVATWAAGVTALVLMALLSYLAHRTWLLPPESAWETVIAEGAEKVDISAGDRVQEWWMLNSDNAANARVSGPDNVRVDSRVILPHKGKGLFPYVLEISLDGKRVDWFVVSKGPSDNWKHAGAALGRRDGIRVDIPAGSHIISARLIASDSGLCLVRFRQVFSDEDAE